LNSYQIEKVLVVGEVRSLKLAFVGGFLEGRGGTERFVLEVGKRLAARDIEVGIFCHRYDPDNTYEEFEKMCVHSIQARSQMFRRFAAYYYVRNMERLVSKATDWGADILFLQKGFIFSKFLHRVSRKPIVSYVHNQESFYEDKNKLRRFYRKSFGLSDEDMVGIDQVPVVCNSNYTAELVKARFPNASKIIVVHPGVDLNRFKPAWKDLGYLLSNGRYAPSKNQSLLVEVASRMLHRLILTGSLDKESGGPYFDELVKSRPSNVTILSNLPDDVIISYIQDCSIFLSPSVDEPFGLASVEAMACGKPVIGLNSGATPEVLSTVGRICGADPREWVDSVEELMLDSELRKELGRRSYENAQAYSWDSTVANLERIFYSCL